MRSFAKVALLVLFSGSSSSSPLARKEICEKPSYGPFRLYAWPNEKGADMQPVTLIDLYTPRPTNNTISVLSVCPAEDCGRTPIYFVLERNVLWAYFGDDERFETVGIELNPDSTVRFVTSDALSIASQKAAIYSASAYPGSPNGVPALLSVGSRADDFAQCTNIPTVGPPPRQDIWYKPDTTTGLEKFCQPIRLVMQSIGIIAEPVTCPAES